MKNRTLILLILSVVLSSCATTNRYASTSFEDAIYQKPSSGNYLVVNTNVDRELEALRGKTKESNKIMIDGKVVEAVYADEYGNIAIDADSEKTYIVVGPGESFEERLTKFDNPTYTINVNYSGWESDWGMYNPWYGFMPYSSYYNFYWRHRWYSAWDPYIGSWGFNNWYSPYYYSYYPPAWGWPYSGYYNYHGYYYGGWGGVWGNPHYVHGGYYTSTGYNNRDQFYGRRETPRNGTPTNRGATSGGSYIREDVRTTQIRGASLNNNSNELNRRYSESIYRRDGREGQVESSRSQVNTNQRKSTISTSRTETSGNVNRRSTESVNRRSTGTVNRTSTGSVNRTGTSGSVNRTTTRTNVGRTSTGSQQTESRSGSSVKSSSSSTTRSSSQYRRPVNSSSQSSRSSSYQRSTGSSTGRTTTPPTRSSSTYSPPVRSTTSSSSSSTSSSSSSSSSSRTGSSGSSRRR